MPRQVASSAKGKEGLGLSRIELLNSVSDSATRLNDVFDNMVSFIAGSRLSQTAKQSKRLLLHRPFKTSILGLWHSSLCEHRCNAFTYRKLWRTGANNIVLCWRWRVYFGGYEQKENECPDNYDMILSPRVAMKTVPLRTFQVPVIA
jgi:hypothetical protein